MLSEPFRQFAFVFFLSDLLIISRAFSFFVFFSPASFLMFFVRFHKVRFRFTSHRAVRCYHFLLLIHFQELELIRTYKKEARLAYAVRLISNYWYFAYKKR